MNYHHSINKLYIALPCSRDTKRGILLAQKWSLHPCITRANIAGPNHRNSVYINASIQISFIIIIILLLLLCYRHQIMQAVDGYVQSMASHTRICTVDSKP